MDHIDLTTPDRLADAFAFVAAVLVTLAVAATALLFVPAVWVIAAAPASMLLTAGVYHVFSALVGPAQ